MRSPFPDVEIPDAPMHRVLFSKLEKYRERVGFVNGETGEEFTYGRFMDIVHRIGSALHDLGMKKGDVLAIYSRNSPEYPMVMFAAIHLGATVTLVNPSYTKYELWQQVKDCGAAYIFTSEELAANAKRLAIEFEQVKLVIVNGQSSGCTPLRNLMTYSGPIFDFASVPFSPPDDVVFLLYSSGTTGLPKGVMQTHRNVVALMTQYGSPDYALSDDSAGQLVLLCVLPFYHSYGLSDSLYLSPMEGGTNIVMPKFSPEKFFYLIEKYRVTHLQLVPPLVLHLLQHPSLHSHDLSSIRGATSGAAPLAADVEAEFCKKYRIKQIMQGYGLTETTAAVLGMPGNADKQGSVGVVVPNAEVKVVDTATGEECGARRLGELWVRGPTVMKGYLNRPQETRNTVDKDGWLHTGDVVYYDEDGFFYIVDRIKELIKYKGSQVAPAELESVILTHPDVADVGVTGVPDKEAGELPMAYVVKKPNVKLSEKDILSYVAERVAPFKRLRGGVEFIPQIPKSSTGKILRRRLKEKAARKQKKSQL